MSQLQKEHSNVKLVWSDMVYSGGDFATWVEKEIGWKVQTIKGPQKNGFGSEKVRSPLPCHRSPQALILPRRRVVERSFAWMGKYRRLSKDYEGSLHHSESMVYFAMSRLMVNRIFKRY